MLASPKPPIIYFLDTKSLLPSFIISSFSMCLNETDRMKCAMK